MNISDAEFHPGTDGRVVKALDSKSNGLCPRRFESCSVRIFSQLFGNFSILFFLK